MKYLYEYNSFQVQEGDIVLIHYWWDNRLTPVKVLEKIGRKYKISHNIEQSEIKNAPDEIVTSSQIIDVIS